MDKPDFRVYIKRLPGYVPLVSLRYEVHEGHGELIVGEAHKASASPSGEVGEVTGEQVRAGRFVHVLASGRRRQSYSLSHLDDDRILRLDDQRWTELDSVTEFGLRFLDFSNVASSPGVAAVQVSASPAPSRNQSPGSASPASARAHTPPPVTHSPADRRTSARPPPERHASAAPTPHHPTGAPVAGSAAPAAARSHSAADGVSSVQSALNEQALRSLGADALRDHLRQELINNRALTLRLDNLSRELELSREREQDLLSVLSRWQERT